MADGGKSQPKTAKSKATISDKAQRKMEEEKDKGLVEITRLTRILIDRIEKQETTLEQKRGFFRRNSSAIQAVCALATVIITISLACVAYFSLEEVKGQNKLAFKQFVIANMPSVTIFTDAKPDISDDKFLNIWQAENAGGPVKNILCHAILLACDRRGCDPKQIIRNTEPASFHKPAILNIIFYTNSKDSIAWIKETIHSDNKILAMAIKISYEIPPELSLNNRPKTDSRDAVFG